MVGWPGAVVSHRGCTEPSNRTSNQQASPWTRQSHAGQHTSTCQSFKDMCCRSAGQWTFKVAWTRPAMADPGHLLPHDIRSLMLLRSGSWYTVQHTSGPSKSHLRHRHPHALQRHLQGNGSLQETGSTIVTALIHKTQSLHGRDANPSLHMPLTCSPTICKPACLPECMTEESLSAF